MSWKVAFAAGAERWKIGTLKIHFITQYSLVVYASNVSVAED